MASLVVLFNLLHSKVKRLKLGVMDIDFCQISGLGLILPPPLLLKVQPHSDHIGNLAPEND